MSFSIHGARISIMCGVILAATATFLPSVVLAARPTFNEGLEEKVRDYFADIPVMIEIARCESEFMQYSKSGQPLHGGTGTMIGLFQISEFLHRKIALKFEWNIDKPEGNMAYARYLYEEKGTAPWLDSKSCWNAPKSAAHWQAATKALTENPIATSTDQSSNTNAVVLAAIQEQLISLLAKISALQRQRMARIGSQ